MDNFQHKRILIVGPQGSGKTTQAKILAQKLGYQYLGTGEMLREIAKQGGPDAEKLNEIFATGKLLDDETICELVKKTLAQVEYRSGFIIDGYPRTVNQKNIFDPDFDIIIYVKVSDEIATKRLVDRGRADDTTEAIKKRLELYHHETGPLLDIFLNEGKLWVVDGEQPIEAVTKQIFKHLKIN